MITRLTSSRSPCHNIIGSTTPPSRLSLLCQEKLLQETCTQNLVSILLFSTLMVLLLTVIIILLSVTLLIVACSKLSFFIASFLLSIDCRLFFGVTRNKSKSIFPCLKLEKQAFVYLMSNGCVSQLRHTFLSWSRVSALDTCFLFAHVFLG